MLNIDADHHGFYLSGSPFIPLICEDLKDSSPACNIFSVVLPAHSENDFGWEEQRQKAKALISMGKYLFWQIDFGICTPELLLKDHTLFLSLTIALDHFVTTLWKEFKDMTFGISIYQGKFTFSEQLLWNEVFEAHFLETITDEFTTPERFLERTGFMCETFLNFPVKQFLQTKAGRHYLQVFGAKIFAEYLHRLGSCLPDNLNGFCLLDLSDFSSQAEIAQLLSKTRFEHLHLGIKGTSLPLNTLRWDRGEARVGWIGSGDPPALSLGRISLGICLPQDEFCNEKSLSMLDTVFKDLSMQETLFRIIPEEFLNEQWDELDSLVVISFALSPRGKRKLQGFIAAGGKVVVIGDKIGLEEEIDYCEFISQNTSNSLSAKLKP